MKKFLVGFIVGLFLLCGCAGLGLNKDGMRSLKFGPVVYTMPNSIPDFSLWQGSFAPIHKAIGFGIIRWSSVNPSNSNECVELLIAIEDTQSDNPVPYMMVLIHIISIKEMKLVFYADKKYLLSGKPSFEFTLVEKPPNIDKFIMLKEDQFAKKERI
jgi:hypothetical protein